MGKRRLKTLRDVQRRDEMNRRKAKLEKFSKIHSYVYGEKKKQEDEKEEEEEEEEEEEKEEEDIEEEEEEGSRSFLKEDGILWMRLSSKSRRI
jgi:hypothetical protein